MTSDYKRGSICHSHLHFLLESLLIFGLAWNENMINMLKATYADPAIESISNSPAGDRQRNSMNSERRAGHHVFATPSSPFGAGVAANVDRNASDNSSQGSDRVRAIRESPNWRPDEDTFVPPARASATTFIHRSGNEADDVFGSLGDISGSPGQGKYLLFLTMLALH